MDFNDIEQGLDSTSLIKLYQSKNIKWLDVIREHSTVHRYNGYEVVSFYKAFLLPFTIRIVSERTLARELKEKELLQQLCGFSQQRKGIPSRSTLAHFREKNIKVGVFQKIVLQLLVEMAAVANREFDFDLPYLSRADQYYEGLSASSSRIRLHYREFSAVVWLNKSAQETLKHFGVQLLLPDFGERSDWVNISPQVRPSLADNLQLPIVFVLSGEKFSPIEFCIQAPIWLHKDILNKDQLNLKSTARYSTACNILVMRKSHNQEEVLLSKRLFGDGTGTFTLPGGKKREEETVFDCAKRELFEETGLKLIDGRPVSRFLNVVEKSGQKVTSVGVLALKYEGIPRRKEITKSDDWEWFNIRNINVPLFKYSKQVIDAYLNNSSPNLDWSDVEEQPPQQLQLPLLLD